MRYNFWLQNHKKILKIKKEKERKTRATMETPAVLLSGFKIPEMENRLADKDYTHKYVLWSHPVHEQKQQPPTNENKKRIRNM